MHEKMEKKRKGIFVAVCIMNRGAIRQFFPRNSVCFWEKMYIVNKGGYLPPFALGALQCANGAKKLDLYN